jgi:hypothetical protein
LLNVYVGSSDTDDEIWENIHQAVWQADNAIREGKQAAVAVLWSAPANKNRQASFFGTANARVPMAIVNDNAQIRTYEALFESLADHFNAAPVIRDAYLRLSRDDISDIRVIESGSLSYSRTASRDILSILNSILRIGNGHVVIRWRSAVAALKAA